MQIILSNSGLFTESTSDGFIVDTSPPSVVASPAASSMYGSVIDGTHTYRTTLRVQWEFKDDQSLIARQFVSISSHAGGEFDSAATQVKFFTEFLFDKLRIFTVHIDAQRHMHHFVVIMFSRLDYMFNKMY